MVRFGGLSRADHSVARGTSRRIGDVRGTEGAGLSGPAPFAHARSPSPACVDKTQGQYIPPAISYSADAPPYSRSQVITSAYVPAGMLWQLETRNRRYSSPNIAW